MQLNFYNTSKFYLTLVVIFFTALSSTFKTDIAVSTLPYMAPPVKLTDIAVKQNDKTLQVKWKDYSDNVKEYEIELSTGEKGFTVIGTVPHNENKINYQFDKTMLQEGISYIRIKSIDTSQGGYTYSDVSKATAAKAINNIAVFPNPAKDELFFLDFETYKNCTVQITDSSANIVKNASLIKNAIQLKKLFAGPYSFKIFKDGAVVAKGKFFKG
jgi:hypothetical protein